MAVLRFEIFAWKIAVSGTYRHIMVGITAIQTSNAVNVSSGVVYGSGVSILYLGLDRLAILVAIGWA